MAGPTAGILLREPLSKTRLAELQSAVDQVGATREGDDVWIEGRPFIVFFGEDHERELQEIVEQGLADVLGWTPRGSISLSAMCNRDIDHALLGRLCLHLLSRFAGVVNFGGTIAPGPLVPLERRREAAKLERPRGLSGVLFVTSYAGADGQWHANHFGDAAFLEAWLKAPDFRMVK